MDNVEHEQARETTDPGTLQAEQAQADAPAAVTTPRPANNEKAVIGVVLVAVVAALALLYLWLMSAHAPNVPALPPQPEPPTNVPALTNAEAGLSELPALESDLQAVDVSDLSSLDTDLADVDTEINAALTEPQ